MTIPTPPGSHPDDRWQPGQSQQPPQYDQPSGTPLGQPGYPGPDQSAGQQSAGRPWEQESGGQQYGGQGGRPSGQQQPGQPWGQPSGQSSAGQPWGQPAGQPSAGQPWGQPDQSAARQQQPGQSGQQWGQPAPGQGGPQYGWEQQQRQKPSDVNPLKAAFDFSFNSYATPGLVKIIYVLAVIIAGLWWIGGVISMFITGATAANAGGGYIDTSDAGTPFIVFGVLQLLFGWIPALLWLLFVRVILEAGMALVRAAEDVRALRNNADA